MARRSVGANIAVNAANVFTVVAVSLVTVPLLVDRLGLAGYGLWALAQSLVIYVTSLELGFGPALARFTSMRASQRELLPQLFFGAIVLYAVVGLAIVLLSHLLAEPLVGLFDVPEALHDDAVETVGLMGWVTLAALIAGAFDHMLVGLERFRASAITNAGGAVLFLVLVFGVIGDDATLQDVARAALLQWTSIAVVRLVLLLDVAATRGRRVPELALLRELIGFSARLQAAVVSNLVNTQTDRVVVGLVSTPTTLGQASIATQVADAVRTLGYAAFTPMTSRMATTYAIDGRGGLDELLRRFRPMWRVGVLGVAAVAIGGARPAIELWLGGGHDEAALFAVLLIGAYAISLLPFPEFAHLRALGRPTLEGLFGAVTVATNVVATVVLGVLFGAIGVVTATVIAYGASTLWVFARLRRTRPGESAGERSGGPAAWRAVVALPLVAAVVYALGEQLVDQLPRLLAFVALGAVGIVAAGAYWLLALGRTPRAAFRESAQSGPDSGIDSLPPT